MRLLSALAAAMALTPIPAFATCTSSPMMSEDGSVASVSFSSASIDTTTNPNMPRTIAAPAVVVRLSSSKCTANVTGVSVTTTSYTYVDGSQYAPNSVVFPLVKASGDCTYSTPLTGALPGSLILANGESAYQQLAVDVKSADNQDDWLNVHDENSHDFSYVFSPDPSTPTASCNF